MGFGSGDGGLCVEILWEACREVLKLAGKEIRIFGFLTILNDDGWRFRNGGMGVLRELKC